MLLPNRFCPRTDKRLTGGALGHTIFSKTEGYFSKLINFVKRFKTKIDMYYEDYENGRGQDKNGEDVFSRPVRAGKRTYFFDVKATKGNDYYLTITESKLRVDAGGRVAYDKHKIFLYKEDFEKFTEGLEEVIGYIKERCTVIEARPERREYSSEEAAQVEGGDTDNFSNVNFDEL